MVGRPSSRTEVSQTGISSSQVAGSLDVPVLGSGDCVEPQQILDRMASGVSGVLVGRGVLRNPWILAQAADLAAGRPARTITTRDRGQFLLDYITLLLNERVNESLGFRHVAPDRPPRGCTCRHAGGNGGSSTSCAPCARGTPRDSRAAPSSGRRSTRQTAFSSSPTSSMRRSTPTRR